MRCLLLFSVLSSAAAFAGDVRFNVDFGNWRVGNVRQTRAVLPYYPAQPYGFWFVYAPQPPTPPPSPAPPQVVYVERDREPQQPQIVVVQLPPIVPPAPVVVPAPAPVPPPVAAVPAAPPAPRVPGPDVFLWTDEDGVVNYSTRLPADARKKAKKLSPLAQ